jgi:hypothetical protein
MDVLIAKFNYETGLHAIFSPLVSLDLGFNLLGKMREALFELADRGVGRDPVIVETLQLLLLDFEIGLRGLNS